MADHRLPPKQKAIDWGFDRAHLRPLPGFGMVPRVRGDHFDDELEHATAEDLPVFPEDPPMPAREMPDYADPAAPAFRGSGTHPA